jgi:hypothetical protein
LEDRVSKPPRIVPLAERLAALEAQERDIERRIAQDIVRRPGKRGPEKIHASQNLQLVGFVADPEDMPALEAALVRALGPRARGNKRHGIAGRYAALVQAFFELQARGIKLPRNKSLSAKAVRAGLGDVLQDLGLIGADFNAAELLARNSRKRQSVANNLDRVFSRIADAVENTPAKIKS